MIFPGLAEAELPARPITALPDDGNMALFQGLDRIARARFIDPLGWRDYSDFLLARRHARRHPELPGRRRHARAPRGLPRERRHAERAVREARAVGLPTLVIPHGTTWGFYTPPGTSMDKALVASSTIPSGSA